MSTIVIVIFIIFFLVFLVAAIGGSSSIPVSTAERVALDVNYSYQTDDVYDGLDWVNADKVSRSLKHFYDKTGIQPYVALFDYISGVTGDDAREEQYAKDWYDDHIDGEAGLLLAYFDTGTDDEGYAHLVYGDLTKSVMDAEAESIFWAYYDRYWLDGNIELTKAYPSMFNDTADRIMQKSTSWADVSIVVCVIAVIIIVFFVIRWVLNTNRKHEAERAVETERILNQPLEQVEDPLLGKYK